MGFIHSWSSTYLWVVAFLIALLTIGPAGGAKTLCTKDHNIEFTTTSLEANIRHKGHLELYVAKKENSLQNTAMYRDFAHFQSVWKAWKESVCAKAVCDEGDNLGTVKTDCYNLPLEETKKFRVKICKTKRINECEWFDCTRKSVLFLYKAMKPNDFVRKKIEWILVRTLLYKEKNCQG